MTWHEIENVSRSFECTISGTTEQNDKDGCPWEEKASGCEKGVKGGQIPLCGVCGTVTHMYVYPSQER